MCYFNFTVRFHFTNSLNSSFLQFTILFLTRHVFALLIGGTEDYPFALLTVSKPNFVLAIMTALD